MDQKWLEQRRKELAKEFVDCGNILVALGDENRQYIILKFIENGNVGFRVVDIVKLTNLSRSVISHHLQILKSVEIVEDIREGTKIYYKLNALGKPFGDLVSFLNKACNNAHGRTDKNDE